MQLRVYWNVQNANSPHLGPFKGIWCHCQANRWINSCHQLKIFLTELVSWCYRAGPESSMLVILITYRTCWVWVCSGSKSASQFKYWPQNMLHQTVPVDDDLVCNNPGCKTLVNNMDLLRCNSPGCYLVVSQSNFTTARGSDVEKPLAAGSWFCDDKWQRSAGFTVPQVSPTRRLDRQHNGLFLYHH